MTTNDRILNGSGLSTVLGLLKEKIDEKADSSSIVTPVQSDWTQATTTSLDYIKNKPILPKYNILEYIGKTASPVEGDYSYYLESTDIADGTTHVYSVPAYTTTPELKYQVTTKEYVDNAIDGVTTSIVAPVQSDWNQASTTALDYIKNKPTIPVVPTDVSEFNNDANYITLSDIPAETDPVFSASAASGITATDISNWNTAASTAA